MPELPEVETTCRGIRPHVEGNSIISVDVSNSRLRWPVSEEIHQIDKVKITSVRRRAKYIIIDLTDGHLLIHLGMSGSLSISNSDVELKKHDHLIFHLSTGMQLRYHDPRRFGCALYVAQGTLPEHKLIKDLGPEPLSDAFNLDYLLKKTKSTQTAIKPWIMQQKIVVGVGNIYASEALYLSGIHPKRIPSKISKARLSLLIDNIKSVLSASIEQGGTTLRDFLNGDGKPGYFQQKLHVYNREGEPCNQCGREIKKITLGQRSTFYCSQCQK